MKLNIGIIGIGRIGKIHLDNVSQHEQINNIFLCDPHNRKEHHKGLKSYEDFRTMIKTESLDAVLICSSTPSHFEIILECCKRNIHVFCEKPVDLNIHKIADLKNEIAQAGIRFQVGFNRRFDPDFKALKSKILLGKVGQVHQITFFSRDPGLPNMEFIKTSGGMLFDQTIHDFDMARYLSGSEVTDVFTTGSVRVDQRLHDYNDIDTATTILKLENGITCTIINSREAIYGYDQRIEVFGTHGNLRVKNVTEHGLQFDGKNGNTNAPPMAFFLERYAASYKIEVNDFIRAIIEKKEPTATIDDALEATKIAIAAQKSRLENRLVQL